LCVLGSNNRRTHQEFGEELDRVFNEPFDLLLGRKTYEIFAGYWPYKNAPGKIAKRFNEIKKYVISRSGEADRNGSSRPNRIKVVIGCAPTRSKIGHSGGRTISSQMGEYLERGFDEAFFALSHRTRRRMLAGRERFINVVPARLAVAERWLERHRRFWTVCLGASTQQAPRVGRGRFRVVMKGRGREITWRHWQG
jgi:hypothetical protein